MLKKFFLLILLLILLLYSKEVISIGISPPSIELDFKPNLKQTYEISLINSQLKEINAEFYISFAYINPIVEEDLKNSFKFDKDTIKFIESQQSQKVSLSVNLPATIRKSGRHQIRVGVMELPPIDSQVGGRVATELVFYLNAPKGAPGVLDIQEGETTTTIKQEIIQPVPVKEKIEKAFPWYLVLIINLLGLIIIALVVYLVYRLKSSSLKITNLIAKTIKQGATAKIEIYLKNNSNKVIDDIYIKLHILRNNLVIKEITSGPLRLDKKTQGLIEQNWHAETNGSYTARLTIYYNGNKTITKSTTLTVI